MVVCVGHEALAGMVLRTLLSICPLFIIRHGKLWLVRGLGEVEADIIGGSDAPEQTALTLPHDLGNTVFSLLGDRPILGITIRAVEVTVGTFDKVTVTGEEDIFRDALRISAPNTKRD